MFHFSFSSHTFAASEMLEMKKILMVWMNMRVLKTLQMMEQKYHLIGKN